MGFSKQLSAVTKKDLATLKKTQLRISITDMNGHEIIFTRKSALGEFIDFDAMISRLNQQNKY